MTVALNTAAVLPYIGNGTAHVFPVTFPTFEDTNIEVEVSDAAGNTTELDLATHFTLSNIGKRGVNGSVTLVNTGGAWLTALGKLATGYTIFVKFAANVSQPMKGTDWGQFAPARFETTLDRLAMNIAAVKAIADKAVGIQLGDGASGTLPSLTGNAGRILQVNSTATGFEYGATTTEIQGWSTTASNAATAAEASKVAAETAKTAAETAKVGAQSAESNALSHAGSANTAKTAAELARDNAAASASQASTSATNAEAAKNTATTKATEAANSATAAANSATAASTAQGYRDQTLIYRNEAETFKNSAATSSTAAQTAKTAAELAETNAETAMTNAETAMILSDLYSDNSLESANQSELFANLSAYSKKITITVADSPYTINDSLHEDTLIIVDDSGGNIVINMCAVSATFDQATFKVGFMKKATTGFNFTVNSVGTDTIGGVTSVSVSDAYLGLLVYPGSPTNWTAKFFLYAVAADGFVISGAFLNWGDPGVDGSWRGGVVAGAFKFQQRQLGVWVDADVINPPA